MKTKILKALAATILIIGLYFFFGYAAEIGQGCIQKGTGSCIKAIAQ